MRAGISSLDPDWVVRPVRSAARSLIRPRVRTLPRQFFSQASGRCSPEQTSGVPLPLELKHGDLLGGRGVRGSKGARTGSCSRCTKQENYFRLHLASPTHLQEGDVYPLPEDLPAQPGQFGRFPCPELLNSCSSGGVDPPALVRDLITQQCFVDAHFTATPEIVRTESSARSAPRPCTRS